MMKKFLIAGLVISSLAFTGCAVTPPPNKDITAYKAHMPKSILVLPPVNDSPDVKATYSYWPTVVAPVAEAGYYVFPISVVDNMFKENGLLMAVMLSLLHPRNYKRFLVQTQLYIFELKNMVLNTK